MNKEILQTTKEKPYIIEDYPYGFKKTQMRVWVESVKNKGDRQVKQTLNPSTNEWNKPKKSTYACVIVVYKNLDNNYVQSYHYHRSTSEEEYTKFMDFVGDFKFNELQKEELKIMRAYIKTYKNVKYSIKEGVNTPEQKKQQEEEQNKINNSVQINYNKDKK